MNATEKNDNHDPLLPMLNDVEDAVVRARAGIDVLARVAANICDPVPSEVIAWLAEQLERHLREAEAALDAVIEAERLAAAANLSAG